MKYDKSSDGCSFVPDFDFRHCCVVHDFYYRNDVGVGKIDADWELFSCIWDQGFIRGGNWPVVYFFVGVFYWAGVSLFGFKAWIDKRGTGFMHKGAEAI